MLPPCPTRLPSLNAYLSSKGIPPSELGELIGTYIEENKHLTNYEGEELLPLYETIAIHQILDSLQDFCDILAE
jgi:hypothetical protein